MKIMLFGLSLLAAALPIAVPAQPAAPAKDEVVVDLFLRNRTVPPVYADRLREEVLAAFADRGRHTVFDAAALPAFTRSLPGAGFTGAETAANEFVRRKIGRLRVTEVSGNAVVRCRIAKGDARVAEAFPAGRRLDCVSDGKAFGY